MKNTNFSQSNRNDIMKNPYNVGYNKYTKKFFIDGPNDGEFSFFGKYEHLRFDTEEQCQAAVDVANIAFKYGRLDAQYDIKRVLGII